VRAQIQTALVLVFAATAGCGSSNSKTEPQPDTGVPQDASQQPDLPRDAFVKLDVIKPADSKPSSPDTITSPDTAIEAPAADTFIGPTPDAFVPGPAVPLVVNSGNTGKYDLADGTWKVFSFDTVQGHFYVVGVVPDGVDAYVGQSSSVSPNDYIEKTNYQKALTFTASSGGKYYLAVVANGASASGSIQVADAGELLEVSQGADSTGNKVDLTAPSGETTYFYYFAVAPGHGYNISLTGTAKNPVTLSMSPLADRSTTGQFEYPFATKTGALPLTSDTIPYESVAKSSSRLYFMYVKIKDAGTYTIKIDLAN
jgi:hypothetical protein